MSENLKMLKKLTPKTVMGDAIKKPEKPTYLFTIYGVANRVRKGESQYGPWTMLMGTFEATRDGVRYVSNECSLPEPLHGMICDAVATEGAGEVQFAVNVILTPNDRPGGTGYEYFAESVVEATENDILSALREQVSTKLKLVAPSKVDDTTEAKPTKGKTTSK